MSSSSFLSNDPILARISRHDRSFCSLIDCIPRSLYRAVEEDEDVLNAKYFKHKRAPMTADERKLSRKQRRRETYGLDGVDERGDGDDDAAGRSDDDGEESSGDDGNEAGKVQDNGNKRRKLNPEIEAPSAGAAGAGGAFSTFDEGELRAAQGIESLKQRLRDKITQLKFGRGGGASGKQPQQTVVTETKGTTDTTTNKSMSSRELARKLNQDVLQDIMQQQQQGSAEYEDSGDDMSESPEEDVVEDVGDVDFSGLVDGRAAKAEALRAAGSQNPAGSKTKKLKKLVEEARRKRQRMEELKAAGKSGEEQAASEAWSDVLREAAGDKVLTNTKRLVKALKRREKQKEKSATEWQNRIDAVNVAKNERIDKREQNIKARKTGSGPAPTAAAGAEAAQGQQKQGGAGNNRAGFEGRKRGFLNAKHQQNKSSADKSDVVAKK